MLLREYDKAKVENYIEKNANHIKQCYKNLLLIVEGVITNTTLPKTVSEIFGICLTFEDIYVGRMPIYVRTIELLNNDGLHMTINELGSCIMLISVSKFEGFLYYGHFSLEKLMKNFICSQEYTNR